MAAAAGADVGVGSIEDDDENEYDEKDGRA